MIIAAYVKNLLFADKLQAAAALCGHSVRPVGSIGPNGVQADLVVVDLTEAGWEAVVESATASNSPILAFGPHIRAELFNAARELGVKRAVANSKFAESLPELLAEFESDGSRH